MKRVIALVAVVAAIAWCGVSFANVQTEIDRARALAAGTYPLQFQPRSASSGNSVVVESASIPPDESGTVGIYVTNDVAVRCIQIPLAIRSVDPGSYMTHMEATYDENSRLDSHMNGEYEGTAYVIPIINTFPFFSTSAGMFTGRTAPPDYTSPDGILFARHRIRPENNLPAGSDGIPGDGVPMITITFQVNDLPGRFEIDTCFIGPSNHIMFINGADIGEPGYMTAITPDFTKGIVTIEEIPGSFVPPPPVTEEPPPAAADDTVIAEEPADTLVAHDPWNNDQASDTSVFELLPIDTTMWVDGPVMPGDTSPVYGNFDSAGVAEPGDWTMRDHPTDKAAAAPVSNYPNPFNAGTSIRYSLDGMRHVMIEVYDLLGRRVISLVDVHQSPGEYTVPWNGHDTHGNPVAAGIYFYRVQKGDFQTVGKMVLLK